MLIVVTTQQIVEILTGIGEVALATALISLPVGWAFWRA